MQKDTEFLKQAVALAKMGRGQVAPNPPVGAVIVKGGEVIGEGWHQKAGTPHAERNAIADARAKGRDVRGAEIYVSLEPCSTHGRTGACVEAIIEAGITRCVYAQRDPNAAHAGRADGILGKAGIEVVYQPLDEAADSIRGFRSLHERERPWVIAKVAMSLDGRITRLPGEEQWLTGGEARASVHRLRASVDGIITGRRTVETDDPELTVRGEAWKEVLENYASSGIEPQQPWRVVMQREGALADDAKIIGSDGRFLNYTGSNPAEVLSELRGKGLTTVMLEAGGRLLGAFNDTNLIDEWWIYLAPMLTGGNSTALGGEGAENIAVAKNLIGVTFQQVGADVLLKGRVR